MNIVQSLVAFLGRALLSLIFISAAIGSIADWQGTMQYFNQGLTDGLALSIGNPSVQSAIEWCLANASAVLSTGIAFQLIGGLLVFLGIWVRLGAVLLILFLIAASLMFHHFWLLQGVDRQMQMIHFMKNLSISGGLLFILAVGKGGKTTATCEKSV